MQASIDAGMHSNSCKAEVSLQRWYEILRNETVEFRRLQSAMHKRKRQSQLFAGAYSYKDLGATETDHKLRVRRGLKESLSMMQELKE